MHVRRSHVATVASAGQQRLLALAATIGRARIAADDPTVQALMEQARGELRQALHHRHDVVHVTITDNGTGGAVATARGGPAGLTDRVNALAGTLHIHSPAGNGTRLTAELPCAS